MKPKYVQMLRGLKNGGASEWTVYILRCGDGSLYTGIAKDIEHRLKQHAAGRGAAYTKTHLPVELVYRESPFTRSEALIREAAIKRLPRPRKNEIVELFNAGLGVPRRKIKAKKRVM